MDNPVDQLEKTEDVRGSGERQRERLAGGPHLDIEQSLEEFCQAYQKANW